MTSKSNLWAAHDKAWRHPAQALTHWPAAAPINPKLLEARVTGAWWSTLAKAGLTLLVTREYEHLAMAMTVLRGKPYITYMTMPHPSGMAVDHQRGVVHMASTRNPNQIWELSVAHSLLPRKDVSQTILQDRPLVPVRAQFVPGCLYMHDLALIDGRLHAAAAGMNAIIRFDAKGGYERVWWPRVLDKKGHNAFWQNTLQLNSIAAGKTLAHSFFSASAEMPQRLRPGHPDFPVDGRGVIFSGKSRAVLARGLTRPHSARLHKARVWVNNSGYGEVGIAEQGYFRPVAKLSGWTRGLCFAGDIAFVGTSRVLPRFKAYAPGLRQDKSYCGLTALHTKTGEILGSIQWPYGNQIFAVDWMPLAMTTGFAFVQAKGRHAPARSDLFYAFSLTDKGASQ